MIGRKEVCYTFTYSNSPWDVLFVKEITTLPKQNKYQLRYYLGPVERTDQVSLFVKPLKSFNWNQDKSNCRWLWHSTVSMYTYYRFVPGSNSDPLVSHANNYLLVWITTHQVDFFVRYFLYFKVIVVFFVVPVHNW